MAETTQNYNLTCPSETDYYNIAVQNENMQKIDSALSGCINAGVYIGDGESTRTITLPRTPKFVLVLSQGSGLFHVSQGYNQYGGLAIEGYPAVRMENCVEIVEGGFRVTHLPDGCPEDLAIRLYLNTTGTRYSYIWG